MSDMLMSANRRSKRQDTQGGGGSIQAIVPLAARGTVTEAIASQLIRLIIDGYWKPGERLPSELELARRFQAGRGALREALKALAVVGLVTVQRGKGTFIAPRDGF